MPKDFIQAVSWYRKAADQGLPYAQASLGNCYLVGEGVAKDYAEAFAWYKKAANQGLDLGQSELGLCYANGWGVEKDEVEAYAYFNLAGITHEPARKALSALEKKMSSKSVLAGQARTKVLQKEIEAKRSVK
jgi:TPR repeat protein